MEKLCANCIYGTKPQSSKSVGKTQQKMQLALQEQRAGHGKCGPRLPRLPKMLYT